MSCDSSSTTTDNNCDKTSIKTTLLSNKDYYSNSKTSITKKSKNNSNDQQIDSKEEKETTKNSDPVSGGGGGVVDTTIVDNMMLTTTMQTSMNDPSSSSSSSSSSSTATATATVTSTGNSTSSTNSSSNSRNSSGRASGSGGSGGRSMQHPNIHHHPVIRPHHNRYHQRAMSSSGSSSTTAQTPTSPTTLTTMLTTSSTSAAICSGGGGQDDDTNKQQSKQQQLIQDDKMTTTIPNNNNNNSPTLIEPSSPTSPLDSSHLNIDPVFYRDELKKTEEEIVAMQDLINKLNNEIFKDPQNHIRPPSEYLEVYNRFTALLHCMQKKKETLEQEIKISQEAMNSRSTNMQSKSNNDSNSSLFESSNATSPLLGVAGSQQPPPPFEIVSYSPSPPSIRHPAENHHHHHHQQQQQQQDEDVAVAGFAAETTGSSSSSPPTNSNAFLSSSPSKQHQLQQHGMMLNDAAADVEASYRKPPLPKNALPKVRLEHPTTLMTSSSTTTTTTTTSNSTSPPTTSKQSKLKQQQQQQQATTPTLPITNRNGSQQQQLPSTLISSASTSPATTPTFANYYYSSKQGQQQQQQQQESSSSSSPPNHLSTSTSTISLPLAANNVSQSQQQQQQYQQQQQHQVHLNSNGLISYNRSFGDISEMASMIGASNTATTMATTPTTSLSPSASSATTPTYNPLPSSSFLRVYIGTSTAVVEKKPTTLKDALYTKIKSRNLDIEKCIAYIKDANLKIEWDYEVNKLNADHIVVAEISDQIRHSFEKKTFTLRSCESCKKRFLLNAYVCSKCDYVMCQRNECRARSERIVCAQRRVSVESSSTKSSSTLNKPEFDIFGRPESPETSITNISQQILPVNQLKVNPTSRDRSRSETELNMFVNPKLTNDTSRPVPKSPSTLAKSNINKNYNTIPRKPVINPNNNLDSDISGSANEGSGSVITSIGKVASGIHLKPEISHKTEKPIKQSKPFRRDSFNSWEIPFTQIKIDMNKKVGSGSFGIVHQGRDFYHGTVAIKFLNVQNPTPSQAQAFRNEVAILKSLRHDCILLFIGCILKPYLAIVTEWCPGSSLYRHLHVQEEHWDVNQLIEIAKQTAIGMEYLHARNILHRDLKSNNIFLIPKETNPTQTSVPSRNANNRNRLLNEFLSTSPGSQFEPKWLVKIGDFGLATVKSAAWNNQGENSSSNQAASQSLSSPATRNNQPTGSILWMAPEVITQKVLDPYTPKSDVYSYGVVLYELLTGQLPYSHKEQNTILFMVGSGRLKPNPDDLRDDTPNDVKDLMVACCQYDRNKRCDFVEINDRLRKTKMVKSKLNRVQRSQSLPCLSFVPAMNLYDDELYPSTPHPDMLSTNNNRMMNLNEFVDSQDFLNLHSNNPTSSDEAAANSNAAEGLNNASSQTSIINL